MLTLVHQIFRMGMLSTASVNTTNGTTRYVESQLDTTFFNPGEHKETFDSTTDPRFDGYIARQYHKCVFFACVLCVTSPACN